MENPHPQARSSDRISNLPQELAVKILNNLPIRDSARTSILSRSWRHKWHNIPFLIFNNHFLDSMGGRSAADRIIATIDQIVSSHRGPIFAFYLAIGGVPVNPSAINPVINKVLERGHVWSLTLYPSADQYHTLPSELYFYPILSQLNLCMCIFKPPPGFNGFARLTSMVFTFVQITSDVLSHLISNSPLLDWLSFTSIDLLGSLAIVAPKLKYVRFSGPLTLVSLVDAPLLETVLLDNGFPVNSRVYLTESRLPDLIGFRSGLHAVQYLELDYLHVQGLAAHAFQTPFVRLETLKLCGISFGDDSDVSSTLSVIGNCPNLKKVSIEAFYINNYASQAQVLQFYEELAGRLSGFSFGKMREIEITELAGSWAEECFIKFVLTRSPALEKMDLVLDSWPDEERDWATLTQFFQIPSLSPTVRITLSGLNGEY